MSDATAALMSALARGVCVDASAADALFAIADTTDAQGYPNEAKAFRSLGRMHRAKVIEQKARLDALSIAFVERFDRPSRI